MICSLIYASWKLIPTNNNETTSLSLDTFWLLQIWNGVLRQEEVTLCVSFHHWVILFFCGFSGFSIVHCSSIIHLSKISNIFGYGVCFLQPFQQYEAVDIFFELFYKNSSLSCYDIFAKNVITYMYSSNPPRTLNFNLSSHSIVLTYLIIIQQLYSYGYKLSWLLCGIYREVKVWYHSLTTIVFIHHNIFKKSLKC